MRIDRHGLSTRGSWSDKTAQDGKARRREARDETRGERRPWIIDRIALSAAMTEFRRAWRANATETPAASSGTAAPAPAAQAAPDPATATQDAVGPPEGPASTTSPADSADVARAGAGGSDSGSGSGSASPGAGGSASGNGNGNGNGNGSASGSGSGNSSAGGSASGSAGGSGSANRNPQAGTSGAAVVRRTVVTWTATDLADTVRRNAEEAPRLVQLWESDGGAKGSAESMEHRRLLLGSVRGTTASGAAARAATASGGRVAAPAVLQQQMREVSARYATMSALTQLNAAQNERAILSARLPLAPMQPFFGGLRIREDAGTTRVEDARALQAGSVSADLEPVLS